MHPGISIFWGNAKVACSLSTVGQAGTVKIKNDTMPKLDDCGVHCLFVGYLLTHPSECYRMYYLKMHRVHISCNIIWVHHRFYQKLNTAGEFNTDPITVGNWARNPQVVLWFIEVGRELQKAWYQNKATTWRNRKMMEIFKLKQKINLRTAKWGT